MHFQTRTTGLLIFFCLHFLFLNVKSESKKTNDVLTPYDLRCEYLKDPLGIDMKSPRFFWKLKGNASSHFQTAYQIIISRDIGNFNKEITYFFNSGKVDLDQNIQVEYSGKVLEPATMYYWRVRIWDENNNVSEWSEPEVFMTGLFNMDDWKGAEWISKRTQDEWEDEWWRKKEIESQCTELHLPSYFGSRMNIWERYHFFSRKPYDPAPLYRKSFETRKPVKRVTAFISGIGYYELYINGEKIGDQVLDPGWTNYKKTVLYNVHDITKQTINGENAIGVMLGRGNYGQLAIDHWGFWRKDGYIGQPKLICRIKIDYEDGSEKNIVSGPGWKIKDGPVIYDGPRLGEIYDANRETENWNDPGIDDSDWSNAVLAPKPEGSLKAQLCEPIRIVKEYKPVRLEKRSFGRYWIDAGTNLSGWIRLKIRDAEKGDRIIIYYGEHENTMQSGQPGELQQMGYIAKGMENEVAECRFSYMGFRYAMIDGYNGPLSIDDITICEVHSDVEPVGKFYCSDTTVNSVHDICAKSLRFNLHSIPTDCPHREKNGWLGDAVTGMEFGMANFDLAALMTKFTRDIFDTQDPDGGLSIIAPDNNYFRGRSTLWSSAAVHVPWYMYTYYGDTRLFEQYWDEMMLWTESAWEINNISEKDGMLRDVLNDWVTPYDQTHGYKPGGNEAIASMNFYLVLKRLIFMADLLDKTEDREKLELQKERIHEGIQKWCFNEKMVEYHGLKPFEEFIPVLNIIALEYGIVPENFKEKLEKRVLENIIEEKNNHLWGGIFAIHAAYEYLPDNGYADVAYQLVKEDSWPSFGWMTGQGATTLWEGYTDESSNIHHFMGAVDNFFYRHLGGINFSSANPGFKEIIFKPNFVEGLSHASASYNSIQGEIFSEWEMTEEEKYLFHFSVPANCRAMVILEGKELRYGPGEHKINYSKKKNY